MIRTSTHCTYRKPLEWSARGFPWRQLAFTLSLTCGGCHLDASNKLACDTQDECLSGYVCKEHECISEKEHGSDAALSAPTEVTGSFDPSSLEYRLSWKDNSEDETGFEIEQRYQDPDSLDDPEVASLRPVQSNVRAATYRFVREGTYAFRVRAVRESVYSAYSSAHTHIATGAELFPWDETKVPATPLGQYSYVESADMFTGSVELRWDAVDFRGDEASLTGYRVYRREASFAPWTLCKSLPTSVRFYLENREDGGVMRYEYAVAAYNSYGESRYWVYVESDDAL